MKRSELTKMIQEEIKKLNETSEHGYEVGDLVGNTVQGFDFEVLEMKPGLHGLKVKNLITGEIFNVTYQNMRKSGHQDKNKKHYKYAKK